MTGSGINLYQKLSHKYRMTKKLEETFNLPSSIIDDAGGTTTEDIRTVIAQNRNMITDVDAAIDKIDAALPTPGAI